ncbi:MULTISPECIES: phosphatidate cytidylyltransferase [Cohnella]|uniref:phosphatidate cytidylyltransferase n=1 Tax=Cohnella TaxID=329857 RepID=UPI0009BC5C59|nr:MULTISPECIES: phosphatidate cytidylyltransferase [Cohnella]MBN2983641.1 phosphatidate cytidylyltransferase [Cohnella algarum]
MGQRIVTGVVAGAGFLALLYVGSGYYSALLALLALIGFFEFVRLNGMPPARLDVAIGYAAVLLLALPTLPFGWQPPSVATVAWLAMLAFLAATVLSKNQIDLGHAALLLLGVFYIGLGFRYMSATRELEHGLFWSLLAFFCIWGSDAGAYFVGKAIGKRKLWPAISPNKTVEGAIGGLAVAAACGVAFALVRPELLSIGRALAIAVCAAAGGTLGDLIQSAYKRLRGVKDSGALLPGHGGALDRTDSWIVVFPLLHVLSLLPV